MKVKGNQPSGTGTVGSQVRPANPADRANGPFTTVLQGVRREALNSDLQSLLEEARARGKYFLDRPDEHTLEAYKDGVRQFLKRVAAEAFELKEDAGRPQDGKQKLFQLVETVHGELDSLTRTTLQQDKALQLLASLDDIRGLVLDLMV